MPASQTPTNAPAPASPEPESVATATIPPQPEEPVAPEETATPEDQPAVFGGRSSSRYIDWDTHELLEKISEYEDERRWQRIREGIWISIILHILLFGGISLVPRYILHQPQVIDPFDAIKKRKDLTYLDELPDALKEIQKAKPKLPPLTQREQTIDKKTLDALKALEKAKPQTPAPAPAPKQAESAPAPVPQLPQPQQPAPLPPSAATPQVAPQIETPRAAPLPAKPNFSLGPQNPSDQLRQAMRDSAHGESGGITGPGLNQHSGAAGGAQILSDTQGVDFGPYMQKVIRETYRTWDPLIPEEVNPPILKRGEVEIIFAILPNGRVEAKDPLNMRLTGRSGDVALDRAAWGAIQGADFPPLPREFHGPYLQLRFRFQYNIR
jgi:TonB family protein